MNQDNEGRVEASHLRITLKICLVVMSCDRRTTHQVRKTHHRPSQGTGRGAPRSVRVLTTLRRPTFTLPFDSLGTSAHTPQTVSGSLLRTGPTSALVSPLSSSSGPCSVCGGSVWVSRDLNRTRPGAQAWPVFVQTQFRSKKCANSTDDASLRLAPPARRLHRPDHNTPARWPPARHRAPTKHAID